VLPDTSTSPAAPVNVGASAVADFTPVAIVWEVNVGNVTVVGVPGVFVVKLPAVQPIFRVSFSTVVVKVGRSHDAGVPLVPAVTLPPPLALDATYFDAVLRDTFTLGADTVPSGVKLPEALTVP
jgi:hypothetical protein